MDGHGQARTNTDGMVREYAISQDPPSQPELPLEIIFHPNGESCNDFLWGLFAFGVVPPVQVFRVVLWLLRRFFQALASRRFSGQVFPPFVR